MDYFYATINRRWKY